MCSSDLSYTLNTLEESISRYNELLNHMVAHLEREEEILKEAGYSGLDEHKESHRELLEKTAAFREKLREDRIDARSLFNLLMKEIVIGHLTKEDTQFFDLFNNRTKRRTK